MSKIEAQDGIHMENHYQKIPLDRSIRWVSKYEQDMEPAVLVFMSQKAYLNCNQHVKQTLETELGGMLVGDSYFDEPTQKHYIVIEDAIKAKHTEASRTHLTFTSESQLDLLDRLENEFPGKKFVGWYHSHPKMDIFLSSLDEWIHVNFFRNFWQVALVIEPYKDKGGFFCWQQDGEFSLKRYTGFYEIKNMDSPSAVTWSNLTKKN